MTHNSYHTPVLLKKSIEGLNIKPEGIYIDATFGGGGHSREILKCMIGGKLIAFDHDDDAKMNIIEDSRFTFINANFSFVKNFLQLHQINHVDGILADLGVSSYQFDTPERGFSIRFDTELDLRMSKKNALTAKHIVNTYNEEALTNMFSTYGELENAFNFSRAIAEARKIKEIKTTGDLKLIASKFCLPQKQNKYLAKVFQALRIEVNNEIEALKELLVQALELLIPKGRLVVISYHSLEDRLVKNFMRSGNFAGEIKADFFGNKQTPFKLIERKAIVPDNDEIGMNNRARSGKLRIAEKI